MRALFPVSGLPILALPILALLVLSGGCAHGASALPVEKIVVDTSHGPHAFTVEIAADPASQELGLMYRKTMAPDAGMLFDFHQSQPVTFWMKNTVLPLDMLFVRADGTIARIEANAMPYSTALIPSDFPVRVVIEINGGRAAALGIVPGEKVHAAAFGNALADAP